MAGKSKYGHTWWGKKWLDAFNNIDIQNRLIRGKSYASEGNVKSINITTNKIIAKVKGEKPKPYEVTINMQKYTEEEKDIIIQILNKKKDYITKMLLGEMPEEFIADLSEKNMKLFPEKWHDINGECNCTDWAVPCKHLAAVIYLISNEIDKNPFIMFEVHEFDLKKELSKYGYDFNSNNIFISNPYDEKNEDEVLVLEAKEIEEIDFLEIDFSDIFDIKNKIFNLLSERPLFYDEKDFKKIIENYYDKISEEADKIIENEINDHSYEHPNLETIEMFVNLNFDFFLGNLEYNDKKYIFSVANIDRLIQFFSKSTAEIRAKYSSNIKKLYNIYNFSLVLAKNKAFIPEILFVSEDNYRIRWVPAVLDKKVKKIFEKLYKSMDNSILKCVEFQETGKIVYELTKMEQRLSNIDSNNLKEYKYVVEKIYLERYIKKLGDLLGKEEYVINKNHSSQEVLEAVYTHININELYDKDSISKKISSKESINEIVNIFINYFTSKLISKEVGISEDKILKLFFYGEIYKIESFYESEIPDNIKLWLNKLHISRKNYYPCISILEKEDSFLMDIKFKNNKQLNQSITLEEIINQDKYPEAKVEILRSLGILSEIFPVIKKVFREEENNFIEFGIDDLAYVLYEIIPLFEMLGVDIKIDGKIQNIYEPSLEVSIDMKEEIKGQYSYFDLEKNIKLSYKIFIDGEEILKKEFDEISKNKNKFVKLKNKYIFVSDKKIKKIKDILKNKEILPQEMLKIIISEEYNGFKVNLSEQIKNAVQVLFNIKDVKIPKGIQAVLRPYQKRGYEWLYRNYRAGFGSVLADDMGLGKTLQVITFLQRLKEDKKLEKEKVLIITPTTLMANWENEIKKFSESLSVNVYYGNKKNVNFNEYDLYISTYATVRIDLEIIKTIKWKAVIIDEAQNIKNPESSQAKAVKEIDSEIKIAITGTPVENRLVEYWSIFDFANRGYLGNLSDFRKDYSAPIEIYRNANVLKKFKKTTEPFVLRRLKTDKDIISDLPDKIEIDKYVRLEYFQKKIYNKIFNEYMATLKDKTSIERKTHIFSAITNLKKICNHPNHYLKSWEYEYEHSGKTKILIEILENIYSNSEKVIIFTQYKEMGIILKNMIEKIFKNEVLFLHGGLNAKKREELIEKFTTEPMADTFILSLKAGGTGLNLTCAKYVIHFDLWWNPAAESQATDRAFRIGQEKDVIVYRLITKGTFEERINNILKDKKTISELTVNVGEKWIGDYTDEELREFLSLSDNE